MSTQRIFLKYILQIALRRYTLVGAQVGMEVMSQRDFSTNRLWNVDSILSLTPKDIAGSL